MNIIKAEIITIGDEILYGQILDTNSQWMSTELANIGVTVSRKTSVGDNKKSIIDSLKRALSENNLVLVTGGLGPTNDDITKNCLCELFNCQLTLNEEALKTVSSFFEKRGRTLSEINKTQALLPSCCEAIQNHHGTAPGMWFEQKNAVLISMPGVPFEMKEMMRQQILPKIETYFKPPFIYHQWVKTVGIGESVLAEIIQKWEQNLPVHVKLAYLPSLGEVKLRLSSTGNDKNKITSELENLTKTLLPLISEYVYSTEDETLTAYINRLLITKKLTIATAESCTGGYIAHQLTSLAGSSSYFKGSIIAYSNSVKQNMLDVAPDILATHGAVSEETVIAMAKNALLKMNTDIAISCSGIAGPDGGSIEKPVGTVWIALATNEKTVTKKLLLGNLRENNIKLTCINVLNLIRKNIA